MDCAECGYDNDDQAKFCEGCGASLSISDSPPGEGIHQECGEALKVKDLPAREIASIQKKIRSYQLKRLGSIVVTLIGATCAGSGKSADNTGLMVSGIAIAVFFFIASVVYGTLANRERKKL